MTTTQGGPGNLMRTESVGLVGVPVQASASEDPRGMVTTTKLDLVDQRRPSGARKEPNSGIDCRGMPDVQQTGVVPRRPQLKLMNPDRPLRYIPIHVWPEHLKKVQPKTGRRYCPKRSRTLPKRNGPSPLVREYRYTEDENNFLCEGQGFPDPETPQFCDAESAGSSNISTTAKRRGWGHVLLGAVQNAVPKRSKEDKELHTTIPRKQLTFRLGHHHPPGLRRRWSRESTGQ
ncbi:hypothetical protein BJ322DRAFT_418803 [Thelephora terrestris]|uniref:Uncharacterized protein n=1 Tax=Thelephora terrestris TaxID=56493 RepID=A0A9P6HR24_9AGAM|nr:hypothetical protein BJ322DRAFT_418803 [Thelephora terrestris]